MRRLSAAGLAAALAALLVLAGCETVKPPPEPAAEAPAEGEAAPAEAAAAE